MAGKFNAVWPKMACCWGVLTIFKQALTGVRQNCASEICTAYQREGDTSLEREKYGRKAESHMVLRSCLKSSNEDGNEYKIENQSRNEEFALTIFPKSAEFVEPTEKTLYHPAARQHNKLV